MSLVFFVSAMTNVTQGSLKSVKFLSPSLAPKKKNPVALSNRSAVYVCDDEDRTRR